MLLCALVMNNWNDAKLMCVNTVHVVCVLQLRMSVHVFICVACSTCPLVLCVPVIVQHLLRHEFMC